MFGCIVAGRPVQTNIQALSPTQFVFSLPSPASINHLVVFLLPDTPLPPSHAATVHIRFPGRPTFQLLGAISGAKPSAVFRVREGAAGRPEAGVGEGEGEVALGIEVVEVGALEGMGMGVGGVGGVSAGGSGSGKAGTLLLAQRIIGNAFNYLSSFGGEEGMVPLKAFREWWVKFEKKVEYDPTFLERAEE